jgi:anaphase-promoting complex subunit 5
LKASIVTALQEALPFLQKSESDFKTLELIQPLSDVQYLISVLYHNLGLEKERDEAAERHSETDTRQRRLEVIVVDDDIRQILEVIGMVGAALAGR